MNFKTSKTNQNLILKIAQRAVEIASEESVMPQSTFDKVGCAMSITACHVSGCPLDLRRLLASGKADFVHDVWGIIKNIDMETGKLPDDWKPRIRELSYGDKLKTLKKIDVKKHHGKDGKLYMPSYPWGIEVAWPDQPATGGGANVSEHAKTLVEAGSKAENSIRQRENTVVVIFRRRDGQIAGRYIRNAGQSARDAIDKEQMELFGKV